jgi:DNA-binding NarL/FixJ family response regulator
MSETESREVGTVLVISCDSVASGQIGDALKHHALRVEMSVDTSTALDRISRQKFEAIVVDLAIGERVNGFLRQIRASASSRTAVAFAITGDSNETRHALKQGFSFALERPLSPESIGHTLKVAYGLIVRERRRYFRYPVVVPVVLNRKTESEVYGRSVNVSECDMALSTSTALAPGLEGTVQFTLPDLAQITAESRVCWNNAKGEAGLLFLFMPMNIASELQAWLAGKLEEQLPQTVADRFRRPEFSQ